MEFLGQNIQKDPNFPNDYIKIDGVVIGESAQYGYITIQNNDIHQILENALNDDNLVIINYNWVRGVGYCKKGFNIKINNDCVQKQGFTAFIKIKKLDTFPISINYVGNKLLNQTISYYNDRYVKVEGVVCGESSKYSYVTLQGDTEKVLTDALNDDNIVVINYYNDGTGVGYCKTGFDVTSKTDCITKQGFTTFIKASKIISFELNNTKNNSSSFVYFNQNSFYIKNEKFVPIGFNAYWLGLDESYNYPSVKQVQEIFTAAQKMNATCIRCHTLGITSGSGQSLFNNGKINSKAFDQIDQVLLLANTYNIKIIPVLTDCYSYFNGNYGDFCTWQGLSKNDFFTNQDAIASFKWAIEQWLNHTNKYTGIQIKNEPAIAMIELGNEFNYRPNAGSTLIPPQSWLNGISTFIKSIDKNHLIFNGNDENLGSSTSNDFSISTIDCHTGHFYWNDEQRLSMGSEKCKENSKGYIIGEYSSYAGNDFFSMVEKYKPNIHGTFFWSMYPHDEQGNTIPHDDGSTIWYDPKSKDQLLILYNHIAHMRNLPEVNSLQF